MLYIILDDTISEALDMRTTKHSGQLVAQLRKTIHKSQTQFAAMIGVSMHTIISVENGRNQLSRNLAWRIYSATGLRFTCDYKTDVEQIEKYTIDNFNRWREKHHPSNEASAREQFDDLNKWVKFLFLAAAKPGRAGIRDRLPVVCFSLIEWMEETSNKFKLDDEMEAVLEDETREVCTQASDISALLQKPNETSERLAKHGIDFNSIKKQLQKHADTGWLVIEDEFRSSWNPVRPEPVLVKTRKLIPQAKCCIRQPDAHNLPKLLEPINHHDALLVFSKTAKKVPS